MQENFFVFDCISIQIAPQDVSKQLGYPRANCVSAHLYAAIEQEITQALKLIEPKGAYLLLDDPARKGLELFAHAGKLVLALATIGPAVELKAKEIIKTHHSARGLIVDAVGTVAAEQTADFIERKIHEHFGSYGWNISRRYAPGYCGWDLSAQRKLFALFPDTLGIKLTESCLMIPEKSLSFVCALSKQGNFSQIKVANCKVCNQKECPYRVQPYQPISRNKINSP